MSRRPLPPFTHETAAQKVRLGESDRRHFWPQGRRPDDHPGLSDLGL